MKVYDLIETWESAEDWAGNDLLIIDENDNDDLWG